jgi:mono/diheme cytochrome c family protein
MTAARAALLGGIAFASLACGSGEEEPGLDAAAARGRLVYENVCTACHDRDPSQPGALGPELAGASLTLIEAKVLRNEYPPGYAPKRPGATMPKYEYLAPNLADLAAYLAATGEEGKEGRS